MKTAVHDNVHYRKMTSFRLAFEDKRSDLHLHSKPHSPIRAEETFSVYKLDVNSTVKSCSMKL